MLRFITGFWFVFLPIVFYFIWVFIMTRRARDGRMVAEHIRKGLLFWAVMLSVLLLLGALLYIGFSNEPNEAGRYQPPRVEDGRVVPGHVVIDEP